MASVTPLQHAANLLWPGRPRKAQARALWELVGQRSTPASLRQYMLGKRPLPQWIRDIIEAQTEAKAAELLAAKHAVRSAERGPGLGCGLIRYMQKKRAAS